VNAVNQYRQISLEAVISAPRQKQFFIGCVKEVVEEEMANGFIRQMSSVTLMTSRYLRK
jgi:hypothetical protein